MGFRLPFFKSKEPSPQPAPKIPLPIKHESSKGQPTVPPPVPEAPKVATIPPPVPASAPAAAPVPSVARPAAIPSVKMAVPVPTSPPPAMSVRVQSQVSDEQREVTMIRPPMQAAPSVASGGVTMLRPSQPTPVKVMPKAGALSAALKVATLPKAAEPPVPAQSAIFKPKVNVTLKAAEVSPTPAVAAAPKQNLPTFLEVPFTEVLPLLPENTIRAGNESRISPIVKIPMDEVMTQLPTGKVQIGIQLLLSGVPPDAVDPSVADSGNVRIKIPLYLIVPKLPSSAMDLPDSQVKQQFDPSIQTPFTEREPRTAPVVRASAPPPKVDPKVKSSLDQTILSPRTSLSGSKIGAALPAAISPADATKSLTVEVDFPVKPFASTVIKPSTPVPKAESVPAATTEEEVELPSIPPLLAEQEVTPLPKIAMPESVVPSAIPVGMKIPPPVAPSAPKMGVPKISPPQVPSAPSVPVSTPGAAVPSASPVADQSAPSVPPTMPKIGLPKISISMPKSLAAAPSLPVPSAVPPTVPPSPVSPPSSLSVPKMELPKISIPKPLAAAPSLPVPPAVPLPQTVAPQTVPPVEAKIAVPVVLAGSRIDPPKIPAPTLPTPSVTPAEVKASSSVSSPTLPKVTSELKSHLPPLPPLKPSSSIPVKGLSVTLPPAMTPKPPEAVASLTPETGTTSATVRDVPQDLPQTPSKSELPKVLPGSEGGIKSLKEILGIAEDAELRVQEIAQQIQKKMGVEAVVIVTDDGLPMTGHLPKGLSTEAWCSVLPMIFRKYDSISLGFGKAKQSFLKIGGQTFTLLSDGGAHLILLHGSSSVSEELLTMGRSFAAAVGLYFRKTQTEKAN